MTVRFRIDGILHATNPFSRTMGESVVNIFKVLSAMDITEKRKPQDGSFSAEVYTRRKPKPKKKDDDDEPDDEPEEPHIRRRRGRSTSAWPRPAASPARRWSCASSTAPCRWPI